MLTLTGILVVILGFALRVNPLLVVAVAAIVTGLASGRGPVEVVSMLGRSFAYRQITAALGLTSLGGHAQMVRRHPQSTQRGTAIPRRARDDRAQGYCLIAVPLCVILWTTQLKSR
jgi:uncharacterized membrane protein